MFLIIMNQVPESLESLKRSIEIDVKNARKSIRIKILSMLELKKDSRESKKW